MSNEPEGIKTNVKMTGRVHSPSDPRCRSGSSDEEGITSYSVTATLEDDQHDEEMDLSIFAPIESSDLEDEGNMDFSDSSGVSTWRNFREKDAKNEHVQSNKHSPRSSSTEEKKSEQTIKANQRPKQERNLDRTANQAMKGYQAAPTASEVTQGLGSSISPLAAMEPPVFPNAPEQSKSAAGDDQRSILLEVLNHCMFLHATMQRLEEKIDRHLSSEPTFEISVKRKKAPQASPPPEEEQLPSSLAQRLGPLIETNPRCGPPRKQREEEAQHQMHKPASRGRGQNRGRGRGRGKGIKRSQLQCEPLQASPSLLMKPFEHQFNTSSDQPQPQSSLKLNEWSLANSFRERQPQGKKAIALVDREKDQSETMSENQEASDHGGNKVMIGSSLRKVWIPVSVYKLVFKEMEPLRAVEPVLNALFPISTLCHSAITGNPAQGIQQLDPNKIEALREFLAEMYPQFDLSVRGVSWAQCLGVVNSITKNLRKTMKSM